MPLVTEPLVRVLCALGFSASGSHIGCCHDAAEASVLISKMIAEQTGKTVYAGPIEATAIGNIVTQMIGNSEIKDISEARKIIGKSFDIETFKA